MNLKLILPIVIVTMASSCSVSSRIKSADSQEISRTNILQTPTLADINVSTVKITGNYSGVHNTKAPVASIEFAKNMAMADAIEKAKCDFIVHPLFDVQINSNAIQVAVLGYPATYKSFKSVTAADSGLLFTINRDNYQNKPRAYHQRNCRSIAFELLYR
jgi:hypothetical protein